MDPGGGAQNSRVPHDGDGRWGHNYLTTINEVQAARTPHHMYGDTENATIYGLADRYTGVTPCCTANHNQAWPKLLMYTVMAEPAPANGIVIAVLAPANATLPTRVGGGAAVQVITDYPFGDTVTVVVDAPKAVGLRLRIPGWATNASVAVRGGAAVRPRPGGYHAVACGAGTTTIVLDLNPQVRIDTTWGIDRSSAAITRGPLLYVLPLEETEQLLHEPWACFEKGCSQDIRIDSNSTWNYALVVSDAPGLRPTYAKVGRPSAVPFAGGFKRAGGPAYPVQVTVPVRRLASWTYDASFTQEAAAPPRSPVACADPASGCGPIETKTLVPFGATRLRIAMFPWAPA